MLTLWRNNKTNKYPSLYLASNQVQSCAISACNNTTLLADGLCLHVLMVTFFVINALTICLDIVITSHVPALFAEPPLKNQELNLIVHYLLPSTSSQMLKKPLEKIKESYFFMPSSIRSMKSLKLSRKQQKLVIL